MLSFLGGLGKSLLGPVASVATNVLGSLPVVGDVLKTGIDIVGSITGLK